MDNVQMAADINTALGVVTQIRVMIAAAITNEDRAPTPDEWDQMTTLVVNSSRIAFANFEIIEPAKAAMDAEIDGEAKYNAFLNALEAGLNDQLAMVDATTSMLQSLGATGFSFN